MNICWIFEHSPPLSFITWSYLPFTTLGPNFHLATVLGGVAIEGGFAQTHLHRLAVVGSVTAVCTEQFTAQHVPAGGNLGKG